MFLCAAQTPGKPPSPCTQHAHTRASRPRPAWRRARRWRSPGQSCRKGTWQLSALRHSPQSVSESQAIVCCLSSLFINDNMEIKFYLHVLQTKCPLLQTGTGPPSLGRTRHTGHSTTPFNSSTSSLNCLFSCLSWTTSSATFSFVAGFWSSTLCLFGAFFFAPDMLIQVVSWTVATLLALAQIECPVQSSKFKVFVEGLCKQQLHTFTWMKVKVVNCKTVLVLLDVLHSFAAVD